MSAVCACCGKVRAAKEIPQSDCWTKDEAIAVMCRSLAGLLEWNGQEADAQAVRIAEAILRQPERADLHLEIRQLRAENAALRESRGTAK